MWHIQKNSLGKNSSNEYSHCLVDVHHVIRTAEGQYKIWQRMSFQFKDQYNPLHCVWKSGGERREDYRTGEKDSIFSLYVSEFRKEKKVNFLFSCLEVGKKWKENKVNFTILSFTSIFKGKKNWILKNCIWKRKQRWKFIDDIDIIQTIKKTRGIKRRENP